MDQSSNDGCFEILRNYERSGQIRVYEQKKRNRGLGRQLAFEKSNGEYVISNFDMDDVYEPKLGELLETYHSRAEGKMLRIVNYQRKGALTIVPRDLLLEIGGWKDLNFVEDRYLWGRACKLGKYMWMTFPIYRSITSSKEKRGLVQRIGRIYGIMRDRARIGAKTHFTWYTLPLLVPAFLSASLHPGLKDRFFESFWPDDPKYMVAIQ